MSFIKAADIYIIYIILHGPHIPTGTPPTKLFFKRFSKAQNINIYSVIFKTEQYLASQEYSTA
jgi:hypothetical protein